MAHAAEEDDELWEVALSPSERKVMTLDQLDEAYQLGTINESTLVCEQGSEDWQPLHVIAGLEPPESSEALTARLPADLIPPVEPQKAAPAPRAASVMKKTVMGLGPGGYAVPSPADLAPARRPATPPAGRGVVPPPLPPNAFDNYPGAVAKKSPSLGPGAVPASRISRPAPPGAPRPSRPPPPPGARASTAPPGIPNIPPPRGFAPAPQAASGPSAVKARSDAAPPAIPKTAPAPRAAQSAAPQALPRIEPQRPQSSAPPQALPRIEPQRPQGAAPQALPRIEPNRTPSVAPKALPRIEPQRPASNAPQALPRIEPQRPPSSAPQALPRIEPQAPASAAPVSFGLSATPAEAQSKGVAPAEFWAFGVAIFLGLFVSAQRHGLLNDWAQAIGAGDAYGSFERAVFNGPSINTPRGVNEFLKKQKASAAPDPESLGE